MKIDDAIKFFEEAAKASARLGTEKLELGAVAHIAYGSYSQIAEWLKELKQRRTIDAVSVVRCKECRYKDMEICPMYRLVVAGVRKYDDYCSYGERKGE